jgi:di/tricarboxylate transporter
MTPEILFVLSVLVVAIFLFITGVVRMDITALLVLLALGFSGMVDPAQAVAGFGNPAVITVWAMFILSAGLTRTGVASVMGEQLLKVARQSETRLLGLLMTVTAILSSFMNNVGVAAMFLPVTLEISRRTGRPASRLLLPMAYGSLLGGLILLIGTASNLIVRDVMREAGVAPLQMLDFAPGGLVILFFSVLYMILVGRHFLPVRQTPQALSADTNGENSATHYALEERLAMLVLPDDSPLTGKTLIESRIGRALGLNILSIQRKNGTRLTAEPQTILEGGDRLLVLGRLERIDEVSRTPLFTIESDLPAITRLWSDAVGLAEFCVVEESAFASRTLAEIGFRNQYSLNVLAIRKGEQVRRTNLQDITLNPGDFLLVQGPLAQLDALEGLPRYRRLTPADIGGYQLDDRLLAIDIPASSSLIGKTLAESRLGAAYGLVVLWIVRSGRESHLPDPSTLLEAGDTLVVGGRPLDIEVIRGLQMLQVERRVDVDLQSLTSGPVQVVEVMLSPHTSLAGKTLREIRFREKFGVSVLAVWRGERAWRTSPGEIPLQHGDALLCYGDQERLKTLARERDFVVLKMEMQEKPRLGKAPLAGLIMLSVVLSVILFGLPISLAALAGCVLMVLGGALTMDEAYEAIEWRSIFVMAAMLPLGIAMQQSGAASWLGNLVVGAVGQYGPSMILAGLLVFTALINQFMPSAATAVIMVPIALNTTANLGITPQAFVLGMAYVIAASFLSPVAHPANLMVMSPGGYRFSDFVKHGFPLVLIVILTSVLILPLLFPY